MMNCSERYYLVRPDRPPLPQQCVCIGRQHDVAVLPPLALLDTDDAERAVDMLGLEPHNLADAQAGAIAERQQNAYLQLAGHYQEPLRLVGGEDLGNLCGSLM